MKILQISSVILIGVFFGCSPDIKQVETNKFTGLWSLYIIEQRDSIGDWNKLKDAQGYILYDNKDYMAVHITAKNYEKVEFRLPFLVDADTLSIDALKHKTGSTTYFAKYKISEQNQTIEHARLTHSNPEQWNEVVTRKFSFIGDTLILDPLEERYAGGVRLKWIKKSVSNIR